MIRRLIGYGLSLAGVLTCASVVKMRSAVQLGDAGMVFGVGVALACLGLIVLLGFPDTRGRGL